MSIIPKSVIDDWYKQYDENSPLWTQYPEIDRKTVLELVEYDRQIVQVLCADSRKPYLAPHDEPRHTATAGAPLAGKSTILDQTIAQSPERYAHSVLIDPDRYGMNLMAGTYHGYLMSAGMIANAPDYSYAQQRAYNIARPASNFITLELLNNAVEQQFDIVHGTTMTGGAIRSLMGSLKQKGYGIHLMLCGAEDSMRAEAQEYRARVQGYYQSTPEEVRSKGIAFPQKMADYFELADSLDIYWREDITANAIKAATYENGRRTILDQAAFISFTNKYEADRFILARPENGQPILLPAFSSIEQSYGQRRFSSPAAPAPGGEPGNDPQNLPG